MSQLLAGVFVGGASSRMGGQPKGMMTAPDGRPIVQRWRDLLRGVGAHVVLVGRASAFADLGLDVLEDQPEGVGPLGGLSALLAAAGDGLALAVACDMPYVGPSLVARLVDAAPAAIVAPRRGGRWEPLFARYDARVVRPIVAELLATGRHALQAVCDAGGATPLTLTADEERELRDWDAPSDVTAS